MFRRRIGNIFVHFFEGFFFLEYLKRMQRNFNKIGAKILFSSKIFNLIFLCKVSEIWNSSQLVLEYYWLTFPNVTTRNNFKLFFEVNFFKTRLWILRIFLGFGHFWREGVFSCLSLEQGQLFQRYFFMINPCTNPEEFFKNSRKNPRHYSVEVTK